MEGLKKNLAEYSKDLQFTETNNEVHIKPLRKLPPQIFKAVCKTVESFGGQWNKQIYKWVTPKPPAIMKSRQSTGSPGKFTKSLPEDTMITVSYSRKVCPAQYESIGFSASVEVPVEAKEDARFVVVDFVESSLAKRLQELKEENSS